MYFLLTASDYHICIFWPLSCISYLRLLITTFVSFDHCLVLPTYGFWWPHLYRLAIVLYFLLTASDYYICIFWPPSCTSYLRLLIITFVSFDHCFVFPTYGFWLLRLYLLTTLLYFLLTLLIITFVSFDHRIVLPTYGFWLPHLYLLTTDLYFLLTASDDHICIVWPLSCTSYLRLLITTFVYFDHCLVLPNYGFWLPHFVSFDHRLVLPTYGFWLPHLYLLTTVLYFLLTASEYHFCIF